MTKFSPGAAAVALLLAGAAPAFAQASPMTAQGAMADKDQSSVHHNKHRGWGGRDGVGHERGRAFASLSPEGRTIMRDAMRGGSDRKGDHEAVMAARDRMLTVLNADRLDTAALKAAMADERNIVNASRERTEARMLAGFSKLSVADRKAFVTDARALRQRMQERVKAWRDRDGGRGPGGPGAPDGPPPGF
jgi:uncharacterized membrane protein